MPEPTTHHAFTQSQFDELYQMHFSFLCNFAQQYVEDSGTAQDICQKVFISLWEKRDQIDPKLSIKGYLFTAVKNRCLNYLRDHKRYRSKILDIDCGDIELSFEEDHFAEIELQAQIEKALNSLSPKCRQVFEMSRFQGMRYREIAEQLDLSPKTVEAHITKAIKSLRKQLQHFISIILCLF